ncbi:MAG: VOC family protein [Saprospiraceae bacterium]|nr:VOC family protein [Saprospiraceae bacterium]
MNHRVFLIICLGLLLISCQPNSKEALDRSSYQLGIIAGFSELVGAGTKSLALSEPMDSEEMDGIMDQVKAITDRYGIQWHRDPDLIVTDLFPADVAKDKEVLLLYKGHTLEAYQQLKADKKRMEEQGTYSAAEKRQIARRFGRLLSYPPSRINELLAGNTDFRTMQDFGIKASNVFFYYKDLAQASDFYSNTLGLEIVADYGVAKILRIATASYLTLVDATVGMHNEKEPKTVALALLTEQLSGWYDYLKTQNIPIKYDYKPKENNAHDGFVAIDPEGYLLEFETFKQHPENEKFIPILGKAKTVYPVQESSKVPPGLGFNGSITWLYYKDLLQMQNFYEETIGFSLVADQGWTKIYQVSPTGFLGLVDERRGMHSFSEDKAVNVSFFLEDVEAWYTYVEASQNFPLHSKHMSVGLESKYRSFVGYDPEGYFLEFNLFLPHESNERLLQYLQ